MARKLLRTRAAEGDRDLIVVYDDEYLLVGDITKDELKTVVGVLAERVQRFYAAADKVPCSHELDEMSDE